MHDSSIGLGHQPFTLVRRVRFPYRVPYKNTLVYRHREVVKDNDKQQPVCFYMVIYKNTLSI